MSTRPVKFPQALHLAGLPWTVAHGDCGEDAAGRCYHSTRAVVIAPGQDRLCEADTVLHELTHAILRSQGRPYGGETEEQYVWAFAAGLLMALRDNPELRTYLNKVTA